MNRPAALFLIPLALSAASISPSAYIAHVRYLASPELKGRATGSPELEKAASYIEGQFKSFGLKPVPGRPFEQPFTTSIGARLGSNNTFVAEDAGRKQSLSLNLGFAPLSFSSAGKVSAPVVFVG